MWPFRKRLGIDAIAASLPREELIRRSRILIVDDELPELVEDLQRAHFSVDCVPDITKENLDRVEQPIYDLILLDFANVGSAFGDDQGLSLLRHIKRVNPAVVVLAYTSKAITSGQADFYRLADGVLPKDAGIGQSTERIEEGLRQAHSVSNLWRGVLALSGVQPGSTRDAEWQDLLVQGTTNKRKLRTLRERMTSALGSEAATKVAVGLVGKIVELAVKTAMGG